jgi:hypothetical protein
MALLDGMSVRNLANDGAAAHNGGPALRLEAIMSPHMGRKADARRTIPAKFDFH